MKLGSHQLHAWMIAALGAAAVVAYGMLVFLPCQRAIGQSRQDLLARQQFIAESEPLASAIQQAVDDLQAAHDFATSWRAGAPSEAKLAATLSGITEQAQQTGVSVQRFDPQPLVRLDSISKAPIAVTVEGSFSQVFEFIRTLEVGPASIWISSLRLENPGREDGRVRCELTLTVFADNRDFSE